MRRLWLTTLFLLTAFCVFWSSSTANEAYVGNGGWGSAVMAWLLGSWYFKMWRDEQRKEQHGDDGNQG